jgi:hypothetical protein
VDHNLVCRDIVVPVEQIQAKMRMLVMLDEDCCSGFDDCRRDVLALAFEERNVIVRSGLGPYIQNSPGHGHLLGHDIKSTKSRRELVFAGA